MNFRISNQEKINFLKGTRQTANIKKKKKLSKRLNLGLIASL